MIIIPEKIDADCRWSGALFISWNSIRHIVHVNHNICSCNNIDTIFTPLLQTNINRLPSDLSKWDIFSIMST